MKFRLAILDEKDVILSMYDYDRHKEYTAWNDEYPTIENILNDIKTNNLFVLEDNKNIIGSIAINYENELINEPLYSNENALEFGRVIVKKEYRGNGYSKILIENIEKEISNRGYQNIHIIVFKNSVIANKMYKKMGYIKCGEKEYFGSRFVLYEKKI